MKKLLDKIYKSIETYMSTDCEVDIGLECFYKAMQYYDNKEYNDALKLYKQALKYEPNSDATYFNMGNVFYVQNKYDEALVYYKQALLLNDDSPNAHYQIGKIYQIQENYKEALTFLVEAEKKSEMDENFYENLAFCYFKVGDKLKSIDSLKQVLKLNPIHEEALRNIGYLYSELNRVDECMYYYQRLVKIDPNEELLNILAFSHLEKKEFEQANQYLLDSLQYNATNRDTLHHLSFSYYMLKNFEKSMEFSRKLIEVDEDNNSPYLNTFESQLLMGVQFSKDLEDIFIAKFQNLKSIFMVYEFLKVLENIVINREFILNEWDKKYANNTFVDWDFTMLENWIDNYEDDEVKILLLEALDFFYEYKREEKR